jgi:hypothetical protein
MSGKHGPARDHQRFVICGTGKIERFDQPLVGQAFYLGGADEGGFPAGVLNLLRQPLESLVVGGSIRQDIGGGFELDGAEFLEFSPKSDAGSGVTGWQAVQKQEPCPDLHLQQVNVTVTRITKKTNESANDES